MYNSLFQGFVLGALVQIAFLIVEKQKRPCKSNIFPVFRFSIFQNTQEEWQTMYFIGASLYVFGYIIFLICGSGDVQEWAKLPSNKTLNRMVCSTSSSDSQKSKQKPLIAKQSHKKKDIPPASAMDLQKQLFLLSQLPGNSKQKTISRLPEAVPILIPVQSHSLTKQKPDYGRSQSVKVPKHTTRSLEEITKPNHRRTSSVKSDSSKYVIRPISDQSSSQQSKASVRTTDSISDNEDPQLTLRRPSSEGTSFFDTLEESVL